MAQAITNTVKSTNPLAGLLGLNPAPKSPSSFGGLQTTTPSTIQQPKIGGSNPVPDLYGILANKTSPAPSLPTPQMTTGLVMPQKPVASAPVQQVQPQTQVAQSAPVSVQPPPGTANGILPPQTSSRGLFPSVAASLAAKGSEVNPITTDAYQKAQDIQAQIKAARDAEAQTIANQAGPIPQGDITGRQAVARQLYETRLANLGSQFQGETNLATLGNTIQGTQQSALGTVLGQTAPQVTAFGQTAFSPDTNTFGAQGGGFPPEVMQQYAQLAASGQYSAIPAAITSNPVLNAQLNVAARALNPNFTPIGAQGASGVLQNIPALTSANTAAEGIKNTIVSYLAANPQLNPSDLAAGNLLQQWIQGKQLTDPKYQTLFNYLNEYTNTLAPILGVGGDATNLKTQIAQGFVNAAASGQSISQVLNAMSQLATNKISDLQSGAVGGGTNVPSPVNTTNNQGWGWNP